MLGLVAGDAGCATATLNARACAGAANDIFVRSVDANVCSRRATFAGMDEPDGLEAWAEAEVPEVMRNDPIWRLPAYRYSLYLGDLIQADIYRMRRDIRTRSCVDQLISAVESISSNIAEGYSRTTGPDRAKYFEYGHSSARESRDWLFKTRHPLDPATTLNGSSSCHA